MKDIEQIGMNISAKEILDDIRENGWFNADIDLMKFALSYAIKKELKPHEGPFTTSHNASSFDKDGKVKDLIQLFFPDEENVYRLAQGLLNQGLIQIGEQFKDDGDFVLDSYLS
jgi:hypothetical protein